MKAFSLGNQSFIEHIEENRVYIDKTQYAYTLANKYKYVFLARPRRFGKTLFLNTLKAFFEGRKELFVNLTAGKLMEGKEWKSYPVLVFDFSSIYTQQVEKLETSISLMLKDYEEAYNYKGEGNLSDRLKKLAKTAASQSSTGKVVLLIDEYDTPMLHAIGTPVEQQDDIRLLMRNFFAPIKSLDAYWRFVYITGITQFSHVSIFSQLNNLRNISMMLEYDAICGFTLQEIKDNLSEHIAQLAKAEYSGDYERTMYELKRYYDGYRFTENGHHIYNPVSLSYALDELAIKSYWYQTGTPTFLFHFMRQHKTQIMEIENVKMAASKFFIPIKNMQSAIPLLYQTGYLSIKDYYPDSDTYLLSYPNKEVKAGFLQNFLEYILNTDSSGLTIRMREALAKNDINALLTHLRSYMAGIKYSMFNTKELKKKTSYEQHFQLLMCVILDGLNDFVDVETQTATGRIDMLIQTRTHNYVMELKLNGSAAEALKQIHDNNYLIPYEAGERKTVAVGIDFSAKTRTLNEWIVEEI